MALELKASRKDRLGKLQLYTLRQIHGARGIGLEVNPENWEHTYNYLQTLSGDTDGA